MITKMYKCTCQNEVMLKIFPERKERPHLCLWCHGTGEWEGTAHLYNYEGDFKSLTYKDTYDHHDDVYVSFKCAHCEDIVSFSEGGDIVACDCGRIYRLNVIVEADTSHIGDINFILKESE